MVQFQGACVAEGCTMLVTEFMEVRIICGHCLVYAASQQHVVLACHPACGKQRLLTTDCSLLPAHAECTDEAGGL